MHTTYLGLGSNLGDRESHLKSAISQLQKLGEILSSPIYETEPFGFADQPWFLNCVVKLKTDLDPLQLFAETQKIEKSLGKETEFKNGPRTIDIDVLLFDNIILESDDITIPHPHMHERNTVLIPLCDIAPDSIHPQLNLTAKELLETAQNSGEIELFSSKI